MNLTLVDGDGDEAGTLFERAGSGPGVGDDDRDDGGDRGVRVRPRAPSTPSGWNKNVSA